MYVLNQTLHGIAYHYGNDPAASVFFNLFIVIRSRVELSNISAFIELRSQAYSEFLFHCFCPL